MTKHRCDSELSQLDTFDERFDYLKLSGQVGALTFNTDRHINQKFYNSHEWREVRRHVILRDQGCDLGVPGFEIGGEALIHHVNPMRVEDIIHSELWILDPEYLVLTCMDTHNAIHYGNKSLLPKVVLSRSPGDTKLW